MSGLLTLGMLGINSDMLGVRGGLYAWWLGRHGLQLLFECWMDAGKIPHLVWLADVGISMEIPRPLMSGSTG